jgi:hypothetical protein
MARRDGPPPPIIRSLGGLAHARGPHLPRPSAVPASRSRPCLAWLAPSAIDPFWIGTSGRWLRNPSRAQMRRRTTPEAGRQPAVPAVSARPTLCGRSPLAMSAMAHVTGRSTAAAARPPSWELRARLVAWAGRPDADRVAALHRYRGGHVELRSASLRTMQKWLPDGSASTIQPVPSALRRSATSIAPRATARSISSSRHRSVGARSR